MILQMKKLSALFLALVMFFSVKALAEPVIFEEYGFFITLPDGWSYEESEITEEFIKAGVVDSIYAYAEDESIVMWLDIYSFDEESLPATEMTVMEFEGHVNDLREYYPGISSFTVNDVPFIYYTAADNDGEYLTAYTWTSSYKYGFVFRAKELTDEVRTIIVQIMDSYKTL